MDVNREDLKRLIDSINEEDAAEIYDFIGYINMKREREAINQLDVELLSEDKALIRQILKSREDRANGRVYDQEHGLNYLRNKNAEYDSEENL